MSAILKKKEIETLLIEKGFPNDKNTISIASLLATFLYDEIKNIEISVEQILETAIPLINKKTHCSLSSIWAWDYMNVRTGMKEAVDLALLINKNNESLDLEDENIENLPKELERKIIEEFTHKEHGNIHERWEVIERSFGNNKWSLIFKMKLDEENVDLGYSYDINYIEDKKFRITINGTVYKLTNKDKLFYFFSQCLLERNILNPGSYSTSREKYTLLDSTYKPDYEIRWVKHIRELPIDNNILTLVNETSIEKLQELINQIELILQFDENLPDWFYSFIILLKDNENKEIWERTNSIIKKYKLESKESSCEPSEIITKHFEYLTQEILPWIELGIINALLSVKEIELEKKQISPSESKIRRFFSWFLSGKKKTSFNQNKEPISQEPKQENISPNLWKIRDFCNLLDTLDNSWEQLPKTFFIPTDYIKDVLISFEKYENTKDSKYLLIILSQLVRTELYTKSMKRHLDVETQYLLLKSYALNGRLNNEIFSPIHNIIIGLKHYYQFWKLENVEKLIEKAFDSLWDFWSQKTFENLYIWNFEVLLTDLPDFFDKNSLRKLLSNYFSAQEKQKRKDVRKIGWDILMIIHSDKVPEEYQTKGWDTFLKEFISYHTNILSKHIRRK